MGTGSRRACSIVLGAVTVAAALGTAPGSFERAWAHAVVSRAHRSAGTGPTPARSRKGPSLAERVMHGVRPGVTLDGRPVALRTAPEIRATLRAWARTRNRPAVNATVNHETGTLVPDRDGIRLDVQATERALFAARPYTTVRTVWVPVRARFRSEDIARLTETIGTYTTWIDGTLERRQNIILSSRRINNTLLYPGQVFSFVATVGSLSRKKGYRSAPTIQDGEMRPGLGGGLCQVSSTLYNAVRRARLGIVERHHHALPVHYVPPGLDATVVVPLDPPIPGVPVLDFRFRNTRTDPVIVHEAVNGWKVTAWIQSTGPDTLATRARHRA